jgi:hypothetical protein
MQQTAETVSSSTPPSFAGLLAALTAPTPRTAWNNDDLAEDVATLSYEHALRTHARFKSPDAEERAFSQNADPGPAGTQESPQGNSVCSTRSAASWPAPRWGEDTGAKSADNFLATLEQNKKCASITIRLSKTECEQLRRRATQAGLTVSAYLRSCTFEAETLRAQVKDVLAELRTATPVEKASSHVAVRHSWFDWLFRLMPRWHFGQHIARA